MLHPGYLEHCVDDILTLYSELDQAIVRDLIRRIVKNGGVSNTAAWQIARAQESGLLYDEIIGEIARYSDATYGQVKALFEDAGITAVEYDSRIYEAAGLSPPPLPMAPNAARVLDAGLSKTNGLLLNLTKTTANSIQQAYIRAAALAELQVSSGAFDYVTAIRNAVRAAAEESSWVLYPSGHRDRLDVAVRRSVLTGVGQTAAQISLAYMDDLNCDLVETTGHAGARPEHAVWQGKVFSRSGKNPRYHDFVSSTGYGTGAGLCGWNCRHSFYPYFERVSVSAYPRRELESYNNASVFYNGDSIPLYDATQLQRAMERKIRDDKRILAGFDAGMKAAKNEAVINALKTDFSAISSKLKRKEAVLKQFLKETGLQKDSSRVQVLGFGRSAAQKAVWANKRNAIQLS